MTFPTLAQVIAIVGYVNVHYLDGKMLSDTRDDDSLAGTLYFVPDSDITFNQAELEKLYVSMLWWEGNRTFVRLTREPWED